MKATVMAAVVSLLVGASAGYLAGYDIGYEKDREVAVSPSPFIAPSAIPTPTSPAQVDRGPSDREMILAAATSWATGMNIPNETPLLRRQTANNAEVGVGRYALLVSKNAAGAWTVILSADPQQGAPSLCEVGSDAPGLAELCR